jgi:hypothetical protein
MVNVLFSGQNKDYAHFVITNLGSLYKKKKKLAPLTIFIRAHLKNYDTTLRSTKLTIFYHTIMIL